MKVILAAAAVLAVALSGCGSSSTSAGPAPSVVDIVSAEQAVKAELTAQGPSIWQLATYAGHADGAQVCVDVDAGTSAAAAGLPRYQHRSVSVPDLTVSEPLEGRCPR